MQFIATILILKESGWILSRAPGYHLLHRVCRGGRTWSPAWARWPRLRRRQFGKWEAGACNEKVLRRRKASKADVLTNIKAEPVTNFSPPSMVNIKTEAGIASPPSPPPPTQSLPYFKPGQEVEFQPILGHSNCRICKSYFPDEDHRRNQHRAQHPDRFFLVNLPVDTFYYNMEEAISLMAKFGI